MKAYKVEMIVIDFDEVGKDGIYREIETLRYCTPSITKIVEGDIGDFDDNHPLNLKSTSYETKMSYFKD